MKKILAQTILIIFTYITPPSTSSADLCQTNREKITRDLHTDKEYRNFICGNKQCTPEEISVGTSIETKDLMNNLTGCFASTSRKAENIYTGLYLIQENRLKQQFTFFGSYLCTTKKIKNDHYVITGVERIDYERNDRYVFIWNGENYISITTKLDHHPKELTCQ